MKALVKPILTAILAWTIVFVSVVPVTPCGPADLIPVFSNKKTPDYPFTDYADGRLGVVKQTYPRIVLFAAYRYMNGSSFSAYEREALVEAWMEFFDRGAPGRDEVGTAIKDWIAERASVVQDEETPPDIYAERPYEDISYDFFPNCSKDAFVVARETLSDRAGSHGSSDRWVQEWIRGQDAVFRNCSDSKVLPAAVNEAMPEWLRKDRAYQTAAAEFYSLNYDRAKSLFSEIAGDMDSPWQQVSEYLVPRTLVREASLSKNRARSNALYAEAEQLLEGIYGGGGRYSSAAERLLGLVKYRIHPTVRVQELANSLSFYGGDNLKQDLIDYTWLLDKFETEALKAEEERREKERKNTPEGRAAERAAQEAVNAALENVVEAGASAAERAAEAANAAISTPGADDRERREQEAKEKGLASLYFYNDDYSESWTIYIDPEATDEEVLVQAESAAGNLSDGMKERIKAARQAAFRGRFDDRVEEYQGGYYGDVEASLELMPPFLLQNDLSEWLITFQMQNEGAYLHSLNKFRQTNSDAWLIAALSKAGRSSIEVRSLIDRARAIPFSSPAFPTAVYHRARLLIELGRNSEAKAVLDEILNSSYDLPASTRNELSAMRMTMADTMADFFRYALRKPYAFEFATEYLTVDQMIERQKSYWDPEYYTETKDEWDRDVEERFAYLRELESQPLLDQDSIAQINFHFPLPLLQEALAIPSLPEYLRGRLALVIWTRAVLLGDLAAADRIAPEVLKYHTEMRETITAYIAAQNANEKKAAALFAILKNERVSPVLAAGFGSPTESLSYSSRWWCETTPSVWNEETDEFEEIGTKDRPSFVTAAQSEQALSEMKKINDLGSAPKLITDRVLEWAAATPADPRIPEALYIAWDANGWDKYGCEGDPLAREKLKEILAKFYAGSVWAQRVLSEDEQ